MIPEPGHVLLYRALCNIREVEVPEGLRTPRFNFVSGGVFCGRYRCNDYDDGI